MVTRCSVLLLTLLAVADRGCVGQVDHGAALHDGMVLVINQLGFEQLYFPKNPPSSATLVGFYVGHTTTATQNTES